MTISSGSHLYPNRCRQQGPKTRLGVSFLSALCRGTVRSYFLGPDKKASGFILWKVLFILTILCATVNTNGKAKTDQRYRVSIFFLVHAILDYAFVILSFEQRHIAIFIGRSRDFMLRTLIHSYPACQIPEALTITGNC